MVSCSFFDPDRHDQAELARLFDPPRDSDHKPAHAIALSLHAAFDEPAPTPELHALIAAVR